MNMKKFTTERDEAFTEFVLTGDATKFKAYCRKYQVPLPSSQRAIAGAIYKAVQDCKGIPDKVKAVAAYKCRQLGMSVTVWKE